MSEGSPHLIANIIFLVLYIFACTIDVMSVAWGWSTFSEPFA
jgi:hypothetical protein